MINLETSKDHHHHLVILAQHFLVHLHQDLLFQSDKTISKEVHLKHLIQICKICLIRKYFNSNSLFFRKFILTNVFSVLRSQAQYSNF
jgi:hypothetical protein